MARVPQRGVYQPTREGQDLQREGEDSRRVVEKLQRRVEKLESLALVGMTSLWPEDAPPEEGWVIAHGDTVGRKRYADLFERYGEAFGAGNGVTTFDLPDLSGVEPAGWDYWIYTGIYE